MTFSNLFKSDLLADVTLYCGGKCKRVVFFFYIILIWQPVLLMVINLILVRWRLSGVYRYCFQGTQTHIGSMFEELCRFIWVGTTEFIMCCYFRGNVGWKYVGATRIYVQGWSACFTRGTEQLFESCWKSSGTFQYTKNNSVFQSSLFFILNASVSVLSSLNFVQKVKGLSTEHGRLAAAQSQSHEQERKHQRNSSTTTSPSVVPLSTMKQECDSLMNPSSSGLSGGFAPYIPQMYRPFDATRKRGQRSPFSEPERQSVLRDGSRGSAENSTSSNKRVR